MPDGKVVTRSIEITNKAVDAIVVNLDAITSISCAVAAVGCLYLTVVILKEHTPFVHLQRMSLALLSIALFANAVYDIPNWMLIEGHRPTGAAVDVLLMINILVMCVRGSIMYQPRKRHPQQGEGVPG